jgi:mannose-6-phosphate isomerase-like protein (cupin superfamily)
MDLETAIADHERRGYRLDMIMPADNPRIAVVSKGSEMLRLTIVGSDVRAEPFTGLGHAVIPPSTQEFVITHANDGAWQSGRAGMQYRDLIPGRLGGRYIASHIRIPDGGPVNDYVHHHRVRFQMIFVRKGWVRVVYEDQGEPFVMHEGDCVLQPPGIRHRVLEASKGLEVIEIGSPAEHETFRDHDLTLPTPTMDPTRNFSGQCFVHHVAATASWHDGDGHTYCDTGIAAATSDLASVCVLRLATPREYIHTGDLLFFYVLTGSAHLKSGRLGDHVLNTDDCCVVPANADHTLKGAPGSEILEVALPAIRSD